MHQLYLLFNEYVKPFPWDKSTGHEAHHSPHFNIEVKNE
jgi:hypothetical protein